MLEINEIYDFNGLTIKCVEQTSGCYNCIFFEMTMKCNRPIHLSYKLSCTRVSRDDDKSVIFVMV